MRHPQQATCHGSIKPHPQSSLQPRLVKQAFATCAHTLEEEFTPNSPLDRLKTHGSLLLYARRKVERSSMESEQKRALTHLLRGLPTSWLRLAIQKDLL